MTSGFDAAVPADAGFDAAVEALIPKTGPAANPCAAIDAFDWSLSPVRPRWISGPIYVQTVSQLLHGERLTARACRRIGPALDDPASTRFMAIQAGDEARHAALYTRYLARLGDVAPLDTGLADALETALEWRAPAAAMVAFNVLLEGEALYLHGAAARFFPCPLLGRIAATVARDEARHTAFGRLCLGRMLAGLDHEARHGIYREVARLWHDIARPNPGDGAGGAIARRAWRGYMAARWRSHRRTFRQIGLIRPGEVFEG